MTKNKNAKKAILALYAYLIMLMMPKADTNAKNNTPIYNNTYKINGNLLYATMGKINIYIGTQKYINSMIDGNPQNIYIIDSRNGSNPDMAIYDSYKIKNIDDIITILEIILKYESDNPSNWERSIESMKNEWIIHNICYHLNIERDRTQKVDLDNDEEIKYLNFIKVLIQALKENFIDTDSSKKLIKTN